MSIPSRAHCQQQDEAQEKASEAERSIERSRGKKTRVIDLLYVAAVVTVVTVVTVVVVADSHSEKTEIAQ